MTPFPGMQRIGTPGPAMPAPNVIPMRPAPVMSVGGIMPIMGQAQVEAIERARVQSVQSQPVILGLAAHVRSCWQEARQAKENTVEPRMLKSLRQRRGEYDPDKLALIRQHGGSEIYMMVTSAKCRGAAAWLRDGLLGQGADKPWTANPSPVPVLPPDLVAELRAKAIDELAAYTRVTGQTLEGSQLREYLTTMREEMVARVYDEARVGVRLLESKMEDQLEEGGFRRALSQFIDDVVTFPSAIFKGPIVRKRAKLTWVQDPMTGGWTPDVRDELGLYWERLDPFMAYPAPGSSEIDDGYFIERHRLRPFELEEMQGTPGYDDASIRACIDEHGRGGLNSWLFVDTAKAEAEGKSTTSINTQNDPLIDALQFWGRVSGRMLLDWGMAKEQIPDATKQYSCEVWLIGRWVIKSVLNPDRLGRKPYYKTSLEKIPGAFWGNSVPDLVRDDQDMCNSAARSISNNMSIASGPQVGVNVERLPNGYNVTELYPWKIHQFLSDPMGSTADPLIFFQPKSIVQELMMVFEKFAVLADEHSNIPRYMTGDSPAGGAGRTATGFSQLQGNAMKGLKQVLSNIDIDITEPVIDRLHFTNMRSPLIDNWMKRDLQIRARGASGVMAKEAAQMRRNEFLVATTNPIDFGIMGPEGRGAVLREQAKALDMDTDDIVPNPAKLKMMREAIAAAGGAPGGMAPPPNPVQNEQTLQNGAPIADTASPTG